MRFPASMTQNPASSSVLRTEKPSSGCSSQNALFLHGLSCLNLFLEMIPNLVEISPSNSIKRGPRSVPGQMGSIYNIRDRVVPCWIDLYVLLNTGELVRCVSTTIRNFATAPVHLSIIHQIITCLPLKNFLTGFSTHKLMDSVPGQGC